MSHIVTIKTEVRDAAAVRAACQRLGLPATTEGTTQLFSGEATGLAVQLPGWQYPVVADLATGQLRYDNFGGRWGDQQHLDRFLQAYAVERARAEARRKGHSCLEQVLRGTPGEAEDPLGQRELLHIAGVWCGLGGARAEPQADQAPVPGGEWLDGACQPDDR